RDVLIGRLALDRSCAEQPPTSAQDRIVVRSAFMPPDTIADLLHPFLDQSLSESILYQISTYIDLLLRWNARINLTSVRTPEEIVPRHSGESLFLARHLFPAPAAATETANIGALTAKGEPTRAIDVGSGAGFPGLPLKLWSPALTLTLVESN